MDALYQLCVRLPREGNNPIRIPFGPDVPREWVAVGPGENGQSGGTRCAGWSEQDDSRMPYPTPLKPRDYPWLRQMKRHYPGMFCADQTFAFPLRCAYTHSREPLGIVLVDMPYRRRTPARARAGDAGLPEPGGRHPGVALRGGRLRGWLGVLPALRHGTDFKMVWQEFAYHLKRCWPTCREARPGRRRTGASAARRVPPSSGSSIVNSRGTSSSTSRRSRRSPSTSRQARSRDPRPAAAARRRGRSCERRYPLRRVGATGATWKGCRCRVTR